MQILRMSVNKQDLIQRNYFHFLKMKGLCFVFKVGTLVLKTFPALEFSSAPQLKPSACNSASLNFIHLLIEYLVHWFYVQYFPYSIITSIYKYQFK